MKPSAVLTAAAIAWATTAPAKDELHHLKLHQPQPGQTVVMHAVSDSSGGRITTTTGASTRSGTMSIKRDRTYERSLSGTGPATQLQYRILVDQVTSTVELDGTKETSTTSGTLVGQAILGFRDSMNRWRLFLKDGSATNQQAADLAELEAYEHRVWFPNAPVAVGQTWAIEPGFIRHLTERDLGSSRIEALMTFQSVEMIDNEQTAVLSFRIKTLGNSENPAADKAAEALSSITGTLHVALDTMLDKKLTMTGSLTSTASQAGQSTVVQLPVNTTVTKTVR